MSWGCVVPWGRAGAMCPVAQGQAWDPLTVPAELGCVSPPYPFCLLLPAFCLPFPFLPFPSLPRFLLPVSSFPLSLVLFSSFFCSFSFSFSSSFLLFFSFPFPFLSTFTSSSLFSPHPSLPPFLPVILSHSCTPRSPHSVAQALCAITPGGVSHRGCGGLSRPFVRHAPIPLSAAICAPQAPAALDEAQAWQG